MKRTEKHSQPPQAGFTLVELMVTLVVAAILGTLTVPSYIATIRKARRMEARIALLELATREERFFSTNSAYTAAATDLGYTGTFPQAVGGGYYQLNVCVADAAPCGAGGSTTGNIFLLTATPLGTQVSDTQCASFSLDSTGVPAATGTNAAACWNN
jgi:type IV pilus assembly protein PilE